MINEYRFYYSYCEYITGYPEEMFYVNDHKVSKEVYEKLITKISSFELCTTQYCNWIHHTTKAHTCSKLEVFKRKDLNND